MFNPHLIFIKAMHYSMLLSNSSNYYKNSLDLTDSAVNKGLISKHAYIKIAFRVQWLSYD